jgi:hypothetical protein
MSSHQIQILYDTLVQWIHLRICAIRSKQITRRHSMPGDSGDFANGIEADV